MRRRHFTKIASDHCARCLFWKAHKNKVLVGDCRRFPEVVFKMATSWCGEFYDKEMNGR